jgi:FkbM family methyltransferase
VIAFEASPPLCGILQYHKRANRLGQLEIVAKAVSNVTADRVPFFLVNDGVSFRNSLTIGDDSTPYVRSNEKTKCYVLATTLDKFVADSGLEPELIKIDVEGAELHVLQGAEEILECFRPQLIVGVHPYWLPKSETIGHIFQLLERHRYEVKDEHVVPFDSSYLADYWCIPR